MIARHERDALACERRRELLEQRPHQLEQGGDRALAQLERVAQQHDPIGALERGDQPLERPGAPQHVGLVQRTEVEIGDDGGAHRHYPLHPVSGRGSLGGRCPPSAAATVLRRVPDLLEGHRARSDAGAARRPSPRRARARARGAPRALARGPFVSAGPYDGAEIRLERVPGGLRLAAGAAGRSSARAGLDAVGRSRPAGEAVEEGACSPLDGAGRRRPRSRGGRLRRQPGGRGAARRTARGAPRGGAESASRAGSCARIAAGSCRSAGDAPPTRFTEALAAAARKGVLASGVRPSSDHGDVPLTLVTGPANAAKAGEVLGGLRARLDDEPILWSCRPSRTSSTPSASWPSAARYSGSRAPLRLAVPRDRRPRRPRRARRLRRPARADRRGGGPPRPARAARRVRRPAGLRARRGARFVAELGRSMVGAGPLHPGAARVGRRRAAPPLRRGGRRHLPRLPRRARGGRAGRPGAVRLARARRAAAIPTAGARPRCSSTGSTTSTRSSSTRSTRSPTLRRRRGRSRCRTSPAAPRSRRWRPSTRSCSPAARDEQRLPPLDDHYALSRAPRCTTSSATCSRTRRAPSRRARRSSSTPPAASAPRSSWSGARRCSTCCAPAWSRATSRSCFRAGPATTPRCSSRCSAPTASRSRSTARCRSAHRPRARPAGAGALRRGRTPAPTTCWPGCAPPGCCASPGWPTGSRREVRRDGAHTADEARALWESEHWKLDDLDRLREAPAAARASWPSSSASWSACSPPRTTAAPRSCAAPSSTIPRMFAAARERCRAARAWRRPIRARGSSPSACWRC